MNKIIFTFLCLVVPFSMLSGCALFKQDKQTYAVDSILIANNLHNFQSYFDKATVDLNKAQQKTPSVFTEEEWKTITDFCGAVNFLIAQERTITQLQLKNIDDTKLQGIVELAQKGYKDCYAIVVKHWDSFSPEDQLVLKTLNDTATELDKNITELYGKVASSSINTNQVLEIITNILTIAIKVLAMVAV